MWKNIAEPDRPQMTIWRMRIACWITKATNTLRTCTTLTRIAFLLQQWLYERASMLPYRYIACRVQYLVQYKATDRHNVMWNRVQLAA
jgi:hypothetical protein